MFGRFISIAVSLGLLTFAPSCGQESEPVRSEGESAIVASQPAVPSKELSLTSDQTVGAIVADVPNAARLFELVGIDYCCGGEATLAQAAEERELDVQRLITVLGMLGGTSGHEAERSWVDAPLDELIKHIVDKHHAYLRRELPRLKEIVETVVRVHREEHPELVEVGTLYAALHAEMTPHLEMEEREVFPAILSLDAGSATLAKRLLKQLRTEHDDVGQSLHRVRALTNDYTPPSDACTLYKEMLKGLEELERDLHVHVHLENNVLIPRAEKLVAGY